ncbi:hypothetical protein ACIBF1_30140 [Spirillospora sp. NPDC050679]
MPDKKGVACKGKGDIDQGTSSQSRTFSGDGVTVATGTNTGGISRGFSKK